MEGYLNLWRNFLIGWNPYFFIIHEENLIYCSKKAGERLGTISLKIATIKTTEENPLKIIINTGISELILKANTIPEKIIWINQLKKRQLEIFAENQEYCNQIEEFEKIMKEDEDFEESFKNYFLDGTFKEVNNHLADIWCDQAKIDEQLSLLSIKLGGDPEAFEAAKKLHQICNQIKMHVTKCTKLIEKEKFKLYSLAKYSDLKIFNKMSQKRPYYKNNNEMSLDSEEEEFHTPINTSRNSSENFQSFRSYSLENNGIITEGNEDKIFKLKNLKNIKINSTQKTNLNKNSIKPKNSLFPKNNLSKIGAKSPFILKNHSKYDTLLENKNKDNLETYLQSLKVENMEKYQIILDNPTIKEGEIPLIGEGREKLPFLKDTRQKVNLWSIIKDSVEGELFKIHVPIYLNEPLSFLQRLAEQCEYSDLLDHANLFDDSCLRLAFIMGFAISHYSGSNFRCKTPFTPFIGETFELVKENYKFIAEQTPNNVSAFNCQSQHWEFWGSNKIASHSYNKVLEFKPLGNIHIKLKKRHDHFIFNRCSTSIQLRANSQTTVSHHGEMNFGNYMTNDHGFLNILQENNSENFNVVGWIKDSSGRLRYELMGNCFSELHLIDKIAEDNKLNLIWRRKDLPNNCEYQYFFSFFATQLNYLNLKILKEIQSTDSRLRGDIRALENGNNNLANQLNGSLKLKNVKKNLNFFF